MQPSADDPSSTDHEAFFRCPVPSDCAKAQLRIGRRRIKVTVQDTSIDGFTILVPPRGAHKLKMGSLWILEYDGARLETHAQWFYHAPDGQTQIGLRRLRDLTPQPMMGSLISAVFPSASRNELTYSGLAYAGFVMALFLLLALPGLGDRLGTADRIQGAVRWIYQGVSSEFRQWL